MKVSTNKTVIIAIPMLLRGGTEIQTLALTRVLKEQKYRVVVCCYYEFEDDIVAEFQREGAEVDRLQLRRSGAHASYPQMVTLLWRLRKYFKKIAPDVVHVQYVAPGLLPILAAKFAGVNKIFATIHYPRHVFGKAEERLVHRAARLCTMFFCNSLATERSWFGTGIIFDEGDFDPRFGHCTIYNAVDSQKIEKLANSVRRTTLRKRLGIKSKHIIGVAARLRSEKGHSFLFHALGRVLRSTPSTTVVIIGDGPDNSRLQSLARTLGIADSILWLGSKSQIETFRLYGMMDVVVVPSEFEGFGLSAAEAMAAELPVVATDVDGLREVVDDGKTGLLVPFEDIERMALALSALLANPKMRREMGKNGKRRVKQFFPITRFRKTILTAYDRL